MSVRSRLENWVNACWYEGRKGTLFFLPLSYVYLAVVAVRRRLISAIKIDAKVIVVGNIVAGGVGKTPFTMALAEVLQEHGYRPGVLLRGYGGKACAYPHIVSSDDHAHVVGDEALMLANRLSVDVCVDPDRVRGANHLQTRGCDIIVCDDGLQHYRLHRDIEVAIVDAARLLGNGYCIPAGPLREPKSRLSEVDFVIANGVIANGVILNGEIANGHSDSNSPRFDFSFSLRPQHFVHMATSRKSSLTTFMSETKACSIHALSGIGNPQRFFTTLQGLGVQCLGETAFDDHHVFSQDELSSVDADIILMTEKDAVKCRGIADSRCWFLRVDAELPNLFFETLKEHL